MTHNEKRAHWLKEGAIGTGIGIIYGVTVVASAHVTKTLIFIKELGFFDNLFSALIKPWDTIKTKMQAQVGFENSSMMNTLVRVVKTDGIKGLYR